jgi:hypothetical protein
MIHSFELQKDTLKLIKQTYNVSINLQSGVD